MILAAAISNVETLFTVHEEVGFAVDYKDQDGKPVGDAPPDMTRAPCGKKYVTVTSFGVSPDLPDDALAMFSVSGMAMQWWFDEVREYARSIESDEKKWPSLHLYWKSKPAWHSTTYLAMDQGELLRTASPLRGILQIDLGFVQSEMLISKLGPDGKES